MQLIQLTPSLWKGEGIEILCESTGEDVSLAASAGAGAATFEGRSGGCSHV